MRDFLKTKRGLLAAALLFSALFFLSAAAVKPRVLSGILMGLTGAPAGVFWYRWRTCRK